MLLPEARAALFAKYYWLTDPLLCSWIVDHIKGFGSSVCEIGAGTGNLAESLLSAFSTVILLEPSGPMFDRMRSRLTRNVGVGLRIEQRPAEHTGLADREVAVSLAKSCLHHFADIDAALFEMKRIACNAVAIIEVVAPHVDCLPYLNELVLRKEQGRRASTIFTEESLLHLGSTIGGPPRILHFDQYIDLGTWLEYGGVSSERAKTLFDFASHIDGSVRDHMQIHWNNGRLLQLRRMALMIVERNQ